jgi:hypothetical protein
MEEDVLGLDIPVDDVFPVHILDGLANLLDYILDCPFGHAVSLILDALVQVKAETGFEQKVDAGAIDVEVVQLHNVWVV